MNRIPTEVFMAALSDQFVLLDQADYKGKFCNHQHSFCFAVELMYRLNRIEEGVFENLVMLRSAWVPHQHRDSGLFTENMKLILEYAKGVGVGLVSVANPFDLAKGKRSEDTDRIFINDAGFRYVVDYEAKKLKQRSRMTGLGFRPTRLGNIGDRERIKKKDRLMFRPEGFDREVLRAIAGQNK